MHADAVVVNWKTTSLQPDLFKTEKKAPSFAGALFSNQSPNLSHSGRT